MARVVFNFKHEKKLSTPYCAPSEESSSKSSQFKLQKVCTLSPVNSLSINNNTCSITFRGCSYELS